MSVEDGDTKPANVLRAVEDDYANGAERPLGSYAVLMSCYATLVVGGCLLVRRRLHRLPDGLAASDMALMTVGTFRASRLLTKDSVTAAVRAPFTTFVEPAGEGEVNEAVPGHGLRHAVGELVSCPFCVSMWIATVACFGFLLAPRATRLACSVLTVVTGSDYLQFAYAATRQRTG